MQDKGPFWLRATVLLVIVFCANLSGCAVNRRLPLKSGSHALTPVLAAPIDNAKPLPFSMKGYELYSWRQERGDGWRHTLITGTNRLKSTKEITSDENQVTESGWVKITASGTEGLRALLKRLPAGSTVFWQSGDRLIGEPAATATVVQPESGVVVEIQDQARQLDIQLYVDGLSQ